MRLTCFGFVRCQFVIIACHIEGTVHERQTFDLHERSRRLGLARWEVVERDAPLLGSVLAESSELLGLPISWPTPFDPARSLLTHRTRHIDLETIVDLPVLATIAFLDCPLWRHGVVSAFHAKQSPEASKKIDEIVWSREWFIGLVFVFTCSGTSLSIHVEDRRFSCLLST